MQKRWLSAVLASAMLANSAFALEALEGEKPRHKVKAIHELDESATKESGGKIQFIPTGKGAAHLKAQEHADRAAARAEKHKARFTAKTGRHKLRAGKAHKAKKGRVAKVHKAKAARVHVARKHHTARKHKPRVGAAKK